MVINEHKTSTFILRKIIGWSGVILLIVCVGASLIWRETFQTSISAYYYTRVHGVFVGVLCMLGISFLSYTGPKNNPIERSTALISGASAIFVGLCPTHPETEDAIRVAELLVGSRYPLLGVVHIASAIILFISFVIFSGVYFLRDGDSDADEPLTLANLGKSVIRPLVNVLFLFKRHRSTHGTDEKERRNKVYFVCAKVIAYALIFIVIGKVGFGWEYAVLVGEIVAITGFSVSWLTKAEHLFGDHGAWFGEDAVKAFQSRMHQKS